MSTQEAEKKQKRLEKQLQQAGVKIAEDIPYDFAKAKVDEIAQRMAEIGGSDVDDKALSEEYFVLDGVFSDESGDYPTGTYVRNPRGTSHAPSTPPGCTIFVKLCQFHPDDDAQTVVRPEDRHWSPLVEGIAESDLHSFAEERTCLLRWHSLGTYEIDGSRGAEILIVDGEVTINGTKAAESWLRFPRGSKVTLSGNTGSVLLLKTGHLPPA